MLDFLSTLFRLLSPLWEMSVTAAYAAAIVIVLRLLLKKRAPKQVLCLLWLVVFARLLIPVSLESPLSIVPSALPGQESQIQTVPSIPNAGSTGNAVNPITPQNPSQSGTQNQPAGDTVIPAISNPTTPALTVPEGVTPTAPSQAEASGFPWQAILAGVWLAGVVLMTAYALFAYLRLRRCLFDAIRARDGAWEHPAVNSPFILGVIRPKIYLPAGLAGQPRKFILCHERAHLRRFDHVVKPICWVALALHWFNPLVWAAYILMSRDIEAACDEAVIRRLGPQVKADYSATLLSLATNGRVPAPCPLAFDEGDAKGRIKNVLRYCRPALWIVVVSVIAAVLAAVCLLTDPVAAKGTDPEPDPSASASQEPVNLADAVLDPWMKEILDGERLFRRSYGDQQDFNIHQLRSYFYGDNELPKVTVEPGKLAILDLDRDGINEMVIWPTGEHEDPTEVGYYTGYLILRRDGDVVYAYDLGYRACGSLKADGTFFWAGSAFNSGTGTLSFSGTECTTHEITWCDNPSEGDENYFVEGRASTREEFDAAIAAQDAKDEPIWYTYADGVLVPWLPDNLELAAQTGEQDAGEAKLWLEGEHTPWLEWNGSAAKLGGAFTLVQSPRVYCRDFDGDGENEVVVSYDFNGFLELDLYEWQSNRPVLAAAYHTEQLLLGFNKNNVAGYNRDSRGLTVTYTHTEGDPDSADYYRHYVTGSCTLPEGFFDGGYEHIRDGYTYAYADQFHLFYLDSETNEFYFDFEFCLADETMQELNYVPAHSAEPSSSWYADHYMLGKPVGVTGFTLRYDGTQWKVQEADALNMDYQEASAIPLSSYAISQLPVPDFLDGEQQLIYRQAWELYSCLFGAVNDNVDFWPEADGGLLEPAENVERNGFTYAAARSRYGHWDDFERAVLSVFTQNFWNSKNTIMGGSGSANLYINVNGRMYYINYGRGSVGSNYLSFRLTEQTDSAISFIMTGHYIDPFQPEDETLDEHIARLNGDWEYSIDFPMRMVKTADGWRFDEFHIANDGDNDPFASQKVPNPNAPAAPGSGPSDTPEPSPEPTNTPPAAPMACEHSLDNVTYNWSNGYLVFTCELDGTAYPAPSITQGSWEEGISEDFDGDGRVEHAFFQNGLMMIVDMEAGQLVTSTFDPNSTFAAFNQGRAWEMSEDSTALTVSYLGQTVQVPLLFSPSFISYPEVVIARPGPEGIYPYTGYVFRGNHFDMSSPVALGKVYVDNASLYVHWSVRYTGGGFQVISDSFQFELIT